MVRTPATLTDEELAFLTDRHLGTLTTIRRDGSPHVVAISFTYAEGIVQILTNDGSQKVRNIEATGHAAVSQVDGRRWITLEGTATVTREPKRIAEAVDAFRVRYRDPAPNPKRVAIEFAVDRVMGRT